MCCKKSYKIVIYIYILSSFFAACSTVQKDDEAINKLYDSVSVSGKYIHKYPNYQVENSIGGTRAPTINQREIQSINKYDFFTINGERIRVIRINEAAGAKLGKTVTKRFIPIDNKIALEVDDKLSNDQISKIFKYLKSLSII